MFRKLFFMLLTACIMQASAQTGNVGVGTSNPVTRLDIAGDVALREGAPIAVSGNNPTVIVPLNATQAENSFYRITGSPTGTMTMNSIANGVDGQLIRVVNTTSINLNISNNNAANGILTPGTIAQVIPTNGNVTLQFSAQMQRWYIANTVGSGLTDWTKATTSAISAVKTDNQYIIGNAGIGDFSTVDPVAKLHIYNGVGARLTAANAGTALAAFDGGSGTVNSRVIIGSNWTGGATRPESQLEFWNNAFGGGQGNSATISTLSSQGTASGQVNGNLLFSTSNNAIAPTERMRIESDGDVGIGTTVPYAKLDVLGSIYTTRHGNNNQHDASEQGITYVGMKSGSTSDGFTGMKMQVGAFGNGGGNNGSRIFFQTWGNSISTSRDVMVINEYGNVGIGTTAPIANLEVYKQDGKIRISDTRPDGGTALGELGLEFTHHNINVTKTAIIAKGIYSWKRADLHFVLDDGADDNPYVTGTNTKMIIKNNGNVGIGTITPNAPLQFPNTIANRKIVMWEVANNDHQYYGFGINGGTLRYQVDAATAVHDFYAGTSSAASKLLMRIHGNGNVYIGNSSANSDVYILPTNPIGGSNPTYLRIGSSSNYIQDIYANNAYLSKVRIGSSSATNYSLEVHNTVSWTGDNREYWHTYGGSWSGYSSRTKNVAIVSNGSILATGDQAFISASDERIKKNIALSNSCDDLDLLDKIKIVNYSYVDSIFQTGVPQKKVIAQQVESVFSQAVSKISDFVPNIYAEAKSVSLNGDNATFELEHPHDLVNGDKVRVYGEDGVNTVVEVLSVTENTFTVNNMNLSQGRYFIFGKQVDDFRTVDYDALAMLNVSATQELYKKIKALEAENARLMEIVSTKAELEELKLQMEELKNLILNDAAISSYK